MPHIVVWIIQGSPYNSSARDTDTENLVLPSYHHLTGDRCPQWRVRYARRGALRPTTPLDEPGRFSRYARPQPLVRRYSVMAKRRRSRLDPAVRSRTPAGVSSMVSRGSTGSFFSRSPVSATAAKGHLAECTVDLACTRSTLAIHCAGKCPFSVGEMSSEIS